MMQRYHRNKLDYDTKWFYREYLKHVTLDIVKSDEAISQKLYTEILRTFFQTVMDKIIHEAYRFFFPGVGLFYLSRIKQKLIKRKDGSISVQAAINWPETKKLQKETGDTTRLVRYLNDHTNRHIYRIDWDKRKIAFTNKGFYIFKPSKNHRQALKEAILNSDKFLNAYETWYH